MKNSRFCAAEAATQTHHCGYWSANIDSIKVVKKIGMQFETEVTHYGVEGVRYGVGRQNSHPADENDGEPEAGAMSDEEIDENLEDTFPASDPPSWTLGVDPDHRSGTADVDSPADRVKK